MRSIVLMVASRLSRQRPRGFAVESKRCLAKDMFRMEPCTPAALPLRACLLTSSSNMHCSCRELFRRRATEVSPKTTTRIMRSSLESAWKVRSVSRRVACALSLRIMRRLGSFWQRLLRKEAG